MWSSLAFSIFEMLCWLSDHFLATSRCIVNLENFGPVRLDIEFSLEKAKKELSRKHERLKARKRMIGGCPRTHQSCHFERSARPGATRE
jgi:hypothetical protein